MPHFFKRIAAHLPLRLQQELKRFRYAQQFRRGVFTAGDPEYDRLADFVTEGDWAIDVGANIGQYTTRLAQLVGCAGRVIAFEPVPQTFELLAANVALLPSRNVTLLNAAASDQSGLAGMVVPKHESGLDSFYQAHLSDRRAELEVMRLTIDALSIMHPVKLVKVDAEGHELSVVRGMERLLRTSRPALIIEENDPNVAEYLANLGYERTQTPGSPNCVYR